MTYQDYCEFYSKKCERCKSEKRLLIDGVWTVCPCQFTATMKWRFDQVRVRPASIKYKTWDDFTGVIINNSKTTGMLDPSNVKQAKEKALQYCYKNGNKSKFKDLIVHDHLKDGQNVIIGGDKHTGKSLLAVLILKEIVHASAVFKTDIDFMWVTSHELRDAARWTNNKPIDDEYLYNLAEVDFLIIDDVDIEVSAGHHTNPPDRISMNLLFSTRDAYRRPTVFICSDKMMEMRVPRYAELISQQWGTDFCDVFMNNNNVVIHLKKS